MDWYYGDCFTIQNWTATEPKPRRPGCLSMSLLEATVLYSSSPVLFAWPEIRRYIDGPRNVTACHKGSTSSGYHADFNEGLKLQYHQHNNCDVNSATLTPQQEHVHCRLFTAVCCNEISV
jgi:hypothetical protein